MKSNKTWWILALVSFAVMLPFAVPYFSLDPGKSRTPITSTAIQYPLLVAHIALAGVAMAAGFLQFREELRVRRPQLHRVVGRVYVGCVGVSGALALGLLFYEPSYERAMSFLGLDVVWLITTWKGYRAAVRGDISGHRTWMLRSFGVTLAAVSARLLTPILILLYVLMHGFTLPDGRAAMIADVLSVNPWAGLVLNMAMVEWRILGGGHRTDLRGSSRHDRMEGNRPIVKKETL